MGQVVSKSKVFLPEDIKFVHGLTNDNEKSYRYVFGFSLAYIVLRVMF